MAGLKSPYPADIVVLFTLDCTVKLVQKGKWTRRSKPGLRRTSVAKYSRVIIIFVLMQSLLLMLMMQQATSCKHSMIANEAIMHLHKHQKQAIAKHWQRPDESGDRSCFQLHDKVTAFHESFEKE